MYVYIGMYSVLFVHLTTPLSDHLLFISSITSVCHIGSLQCETKILPTVQFHLNSNYNLKINHSVNTELLLKWWDIKLF